MSSILDCLNQEQSPTLPATANHELLICPVYHNHFVLGNRKVVLCKYSNSFISLICIILDNIIYRNPLSFMFLVLK